MNSFISNRRLRQTHYTIWQLVISVALIILFFLFFAAFYSPENKFLTLITIVFSIALLCFQLYISAKRLQDCNISGWFSLIILIPALTVIGPWILCLINGTKGTNNFGPDPREKGTK